jgi:hypothetical protein
MKIYSCIKEKLIELDEVSFLFEDINDLKALSSFLEHVMLNFDSDDFDHLHFKDFLKSKNNLQLNLKEVIVCKDFK